MNINRKLRYTRQADFNLSIDRFKPVRFQKGTVLVYDNANLSLMLSDKCNADCNFCIAHLRYLVDGHTYIKPKLNGLDSYLKTFEHYWHEVLADINPSVSITGGEPSIHRDIIPTISMLAKNRPRKKTITSNGTGILLEDAALMQSLINFELDYLNISHAHYDKQLNDQLMRMNSDFLSDEDLARIIQMAKKAGIRVRLSCALLKSGISNVEQMKSYADWAIELGCDNVIFRQLMQFDADSVAPGRIPEFCMTESVDLVPVWEAMDKDPAFELYHQVLGYYYYVEVYKYRGIDVVTESADLRLIDHQVESYTQKFGVPTIFELVYHPNGTLGGSWREFERILMDDIK